MLKEFGRCNDICTIIRTSSHAEIQRGIFRYGGQWPDWVTAYRTGYWLDRDELVVPKKLGSSRRRTRNRDLGSSVDAPVLRFHRRRTRIRPWFIRRRTRTRPWFHRRRTRTRPWYSSEYSRSEMYPIPVHQTTRAMYPWLGRSVVDTRRTSQTS